ncbi:poly(ADP-ribose) glycohydrolase-like [Salarias fasciatus]|uniref:poly(ADP-ribose) glycohydrolase-like n=1 Tax=Salarias fasciatus TaxID=181472 RepID=UPI0011765E21|nr:poly(ADP-ribose) glycohydrolase-like [Salarias fasciatus]
MAWRQQEGRQMKELMQPDKYPNTSNQNPDSRRQHGGDQGGCQGGSSSSFSSCPSSSDETKKDLKNQDKKTQHGRRLDGPETSSSSASFSSLKCQENLRVTTQDGSGGGGSQASSSSSLHPSSPTKSGGTAKEACQGGVSMTQQGSGGGFHQSGSSSSSSGSSSTQQGKHGEKGPDSQGMKTQHGSGGGEGFGHASSSNPPSSPSSQRFWNQSDDQGGKGPGNHSKTQYGSGGGWGYGHASSSNPPSSPSSQRFWNQSDDQGGKGPGNHSKTQYDSGGGWGYGHASSSNPPSSPSSQRFWNQSDDQGGKGPGNHSKTQYGSGGGEGFGHASSSNPPSSSSSQRFWNQSDDRGGKGPGNHSKTQYGSGGGWGYGHASSSNPPSSPSSQRFWNQSDDQGGKGPGNHSKTRHGSGGASGQTESYFTPPSSPSDPSLRSESSAEESKFQAVENHFAEVKASSCCSSTELKRIEDCRDVLGILKPSKKHTVLIDCDTFNNNSRIVPFSGEHKWKPNFVKLPCSQIQSQGMFSQDSRWKQIKKQLGNLASKPTASVRDVAEAILSFNPKYNGQWTFGSLDNFVRCLPRTENYVDRLFPKIAKLALKLPDEVKTAIPLLRSGHVAAITLSQTQIACLLANAFFCTFPHRNTTRPNAEYHNYPSINFSSLFGNRLERKIEKLRAIMHYFNTVTDSKTDLSGLVTFERRLLRKDDEPQWKSCTEKINRLYVTSEGHIEKEGRGLLQVDFANCLVGGGVLGSGLVQEEILFIINPELIVSRLFTERLQDGECLIVTGSQQFSSYSGYSDSFEWLGPHEERLHRDEWRRLQRQIVAIDAVHYRNPRDQYSMGKITRELNKAYCGFKGRLHHDNPDIATGKWGCGAFNGDPQLKAVIQLMAAAKAGRGLAFFTFQDKLLERQLQGMHHLLVTSGITVGKLYGLLQDYCSRLYGGAHLDLFSFLQRALKSDWSHL